MTMLLVFGPYFVSMSCVEIYPQKSCWLLENFFSLYSTVNCTGLGAIGKLPMFGHFLTYMGQFLVTVDMVQQWYIIILFFSLS